MTLEGAVREAARGLARSLGTTEEEALRLAESALSGAAARGGEGATRADAGRAREALRRLFAEQRALLEEQDADAVRLFLPVPGATEEAARGLLAALRMEVPYAASGIIRVARAVRIPGVGAKVAVRSPDPRVDPVGAVIGERALRIAAVRGRLFGEPVDVVPWPKGDEARVLAALLPARAVCARRDGGTWAVETDEPARAIGRGGINVRLAAALAGRRIVVTGPGGGGPKGGAGDAEGAFG